MLQVRAANDRGHADFGWLDSRHTFSFGNYYDPDHMGFGVLRVINEDRVQPSKGFGTHGHRDMEIISYVLQGALEHKDSLGTGSVIRPGDVQRMSAGTGVQHSEFNHSDSEPVHFLQIWILPNRQGLTPGYAEARIPDEEKRGRLRLIVSGDGRDGALPIHQDADLYASLLSKGESVEHGFAPGRKGWIQLARGNATVNNTPLAAGDGAAIVNEEIVTIRGDSEAEILLFDMA
ncbi:MAG TPA: pirin family protein [Woeseiaceae bacterium]|nr:pirin family protein [Woeseiaceae bacterium]